MSMSYILVSIIGIVTITIAVNDWDRMISLNKTNFSHDSLSIKHPCKFVNSITNKSSKLTADLYPSLKFCEVKLCKQICTVC